MFIIYKEINTTNCLGFVLLCFLLSCVCSCSVYASLV